MPIYTLPIAESGRALLGEVMAHIRQHPERLDMRSWAGKNGCGTTACLAGHLVLAQPDARVVSSFENGYIIVEGDDDVDPMYRAAELLLDVSPDDMDYDSREMHALRAVFYADDVRSPEDLADVIREKWGIEL